MINYVLDELAAFNHLYDVQQRAFTSNLGGSACDCKNDDVTAA